VPLGTKIKCHATLDNSADNPNHPDPTRTVCWGDQTWEAMMGGLYDYLLLGPAAEGGQSGPLKQKKASKVKRR
jgi:hypothetical protein